MQAVNNAVKAAVEASALAGDNGVSIDSLKIESSIRDNVLATLRGLPVLQVTETSIIANPSLRRRRVGLISCEVTDLQRKLVEAVAATKTQGIQTIEAEEKHNIPIKEVSRVGIALEKQGILLKAKVPYNKGYVTKYWLREFAPLSLRLVPYAESGLALDENEDVSLPQACYTFRSLSLSQPIHVSLMRNILRNGETSALQSDLKYTLGVRYKRMIRVIEALIKGQNTKVATFNLSKQSTKKQVSYIVTMVNVDKDIRDIIVADWSHRKIIVDPLMAEERKTNLILAALGEWPLSDGMLLDCVNNALGDSSQLFTIDGLRSRLEKLVEDKMIESKIYRMHGDESLVNVELALESSSLSSQPCVSQSSGENKKMSLVLFFASPPSDENIAKAERYARNYFKLMSESCGGSEEQNGEDKRNTGENMSSSRLKRGFIPGILVRACILAKQMFRLSVKTEKEMGYQDIIFSMSPMLFEQLFGSISDRRFQTLLVSIDYNSPIRNAPGVLRSRMLKDKFIHERFLKILNRLIGLGIVSVVPGDSNRYVIRDFFILPSLPKQTLESLAKDIAIITKQSTVDSTNLIPLRSTEEIDRGFMALCLWTRKVNMEFPRSKSRAATLRDVESQCPALLSLRSWKTAKFVASPTSSPPSELLNQCRMNDEDRLLAVQRQLNFGDENIQTFCNSMQGRKYDSAMDLSGITDRFADLRNQHGEVENHPTHVPILVAPLLIELFRRYNGKVPQRAISLLERRLPNILSLGSASVYLEGLKTLEPIAIRSLFSKLIAETGDLGLIYAGFHMSVRRRRAPAIFLTIINLRRRLLAEADNNLRLRDNGESTDENEHEGESSDELHSEQMYEDDDEQVEAEIEGIMEEEEVDETDEGDENDENDEEEEEEDDGIEYESVDRYDVRGGFFKKKHMLPGSLRCSRNIHTYGGEEEGEDQSTDETVFVQQDEQGELCCGVNVRILQGVRWLNRDYGQNKESGRRCSRYILWRLRKLLHSYPTSVTCQTFLRCSEALVSENRTYMQNGGIGSSVRRGLLDIFVYASPQTILLHCPRDPFPSKATLVTSLGRWRAVNREGQGVLINKDPQIVKLIAGTDPTDAELLSRHFQKTSAISRSKETFKTVLKDDNTIVGHLINTKTIEIVRSVPPLDRDCLETLMRVTGGEKRSVQVEGKKMDLFSMCFKAGRTNRELFFTTWLAILKVMFRPQVHIAALSYPGALSFGLVPRPVRPIVSSLYTPKQLNLVHDTGVDETPRNAISSFQPIPFCEFRGPVARQRKQPAVLPKKHRELLKILTSCGEKGYTPKQEEVGRSRRTRGATTEREIMAKLVAAGKAKCVQAPRDFVYVSSEFEHAFQAFPDDPDTEMGEFISVDGTFNKSEALALEDIIINSVCAAPGMTLEMLLNFLTATHAPSTIKITVNNLIADGRLHARLIMRDPVSLFGPVSLMEMVVSNVFDASKLAAKCGFPKYDVVLRSSSIQNDLFL